MSQIFPPWTNTFAKVSLTGGLLGGFALAWLIRDWNRSPYVTGATVVREQPVPFSHKHHVQDVGLDCRYCHTYAEEGPVAGLPPTQTCMHCHSLVWADSPILEPVRSSFRTGVPIEWNRVHDLPDFATFDHSIHVAKGVACVTCHGAVDRMPLMWKQHTLFMEWCLDCHRDPARFTSAPEEVFKSAPESAPPGRAGAASTNCSRCHQ